MLYLENKSTMADDLTRQIEKVNALAWGKHKIELLYDTAEPADSKQWLSKVGFAREHCLVPYGSDYAICLDDKLVYAFERKGGVDLASSLSDKRFQEQLFKMRGLPVTVQNIFFIIEQKKGGSNWQRGGGGGGGHQSHQMGGVQDIRRFHGALTDVVVKNDMRLLFTRSLVDTLHLLLKFVDKLQREADACLSRLRNYGKFQGCMTTEAWQEYVQQLKSSTITASESSIPTSPEAATSSLQAVGRELEFLQAYAVEKKDVRNQTTCFAQQLQVVPGVSLIKALAVTAIWPDLFSLMNSMHNQPRDTFEQLAAIQVVNGDGAGDKSSRAFGPALAKKMFHMLFAQFDEASIQKPKREQRCTKNKRADSDASAAPKKRAKIIGKLGQDTQSAVQVMLHSDNVNATSG